MTVRLEGATKRFVGLSIDSKPTLGRQADGSTTTAADLPPGSSFLESDTGSLYRWDGEAWHMTTSGVSTAAVARTDPLLVAIQALTDVVERLRIGMIEAGTCQDV